MKQTLLCSSLAVMLAACGGGMEDGIQDPVQTPDTNAPAVPAPPPANNASVVMPETPAPVPAPSSPAPAQVAEAPGPVAPNIRTYRFNCVDPKSGPDIITSILVDIDDSVFPWKTIRLIPGDPMVSYGGWVDDPDGSKIANGEVQSYEVTSAYFSARIGSTVMSIQGRYYPTQYYFYEGVLDAVWLDYNNTTWSSALQCRFP